MILDRRTAKQAMMLFATIAVCTAQSYADAPNVAASPTECQPEAREHANVTFGSPPPLPSGSTNVIQIRDAFWSGVDYYASLESVGQHTVARRVIVSLERAMDHYHDVVCRSAYRLTTATPARTMQSNVSLGNCVRTTRRSVAVLLKCRDANARARRQGKRATMAAPSMGD